MAQTRTRIEPSREIPVVNEVDVLVAGGGPAGLGAAIAAARLGARTLLVEQFGVLGGMATTGLVCHIQRWTINSQRILGGLVWELEQRTSALDQRLNRQGPWNIGREGVGISPFDPEHFKLVADQMVTEAGVQLLLHSFVANVLQEGSQVTAVVVQNKSGRHAILAKIFVDCTGDGDLATLAGAPFEKGAKDSSFLQAMTMCFRVANADTSALADHPLHNGQDVPIREAMLKAIAKGDLPTLGGPWLVPNVRGELRINAARQWGDSTNVEDLTRTSVEGRRLVWVFFEWLRSNFPEFKDSHIIDTAFHIGVRESRRILGDYVLTLEDVRSGRRFPDTIALGAHAVDIHSTTESSAHHMAWLPQAYGIPYRCLLPLGLDNVLVAGRCLSSTHEAQASARVMGQCMAMGEAAGTAAALALRHDCLPRQVKLSELQDQLRQQGALINNGIPMMRVEATKR